MHVLEIRWWQWQAQRVVKRTDPIPDWQVCLVIVLFAIPLLLKLGL
jgi:hypothetical protein